MAPSVPRAPYCERLAQREAALRRGVARIAEICEAMPDVSAAYVFGSYATGAIRIRSDLDVLVVRDTTLRRAERDLEIRKAFDGSVGLDLIVVTPSEFRDILPTTSFGQTILAKNIQIYAA